MAETEGRAKRRGRILRIVLVVSLALNLLVLGVMAGGLMKGAQMHRAGHAPDLRALWLALPESARGEMRQANGPRDRDAQREERRERAAARQAELLALLRAPEFDAQAFSAALMAEQTERAERIESLQQSFVARVSTLDAAERALMAQRLEEGRLEGGRSQRSPRR